MDFFPYEFETEISTHDVGSERYVYTVIWVPETTIKMLGNALPSRPRVVGEVDQMPITSALQPVGGRFYILLSKAKLKRLGKKLGDRVRVAFRLDATDRVDLPQALSNALQNDTEMRELWEEQTPGKQRSLAYLVSSAKTAATQEKRLEKVRLILSGEIDLRGNPI